MYFNLVFQIVFNWNKSAKEFKLFELLPFKDYVNMAYHQKQFDQRVMLPEMPKNLILN